VTSEGAPYSSSLAASATVDRRLEPIKKLSSQKEATKVWPDESTKHRRWAYEKCIHDL